MTIRECKNCRGLSLCSVEENFSVNFAQQWWVFRALSVVREKRELQREPMVIIVNLQSMVIPDHD